MLEHKTWDFSQIHFKIFECHKIVIRQLVRNIQSRCEFFVEIFMTCRFWWSHIIKIKLIAYYKQPTKINKMFYELCENFRLKFYACAPEKQLFCGYWQLRLKLLKHIHKYVCMPNLWYKYLLFNNFINQ